LNYREKLNLGNRFKKLGESINSQIGDIIAWQNVNLDSKGWIAIKAIRKLNRVNIQQLASILMVSHPAVVQLVSQLLKADYIYSEKSESDKRNTFLKLTEKGLSMYNLIEPMMTEAEVTLEQQLSATGYDIGDVILKLENEFNQKKYYSLAISSIKTRQMNQVKIVPFNKKYKNDFKRLNIEWLEKYSSFEPFDDKILSSPEKEIIKKGGEVFFALLDNEVVGTCAVIKINELTYELAKMVVMERLQGKQIGKKLCLTAIGFAVSNNAEKIGLNINSNSAAAIDFFRKLGFLVVQNNFDNKVKRDLIRMELNLIS
jgi:DNA-binding MarR family transcriptional regulator/N-acetylglutamate synthase-like GNAT family acetyltransferase